uniref:Odorant receptor 29 n=1 Tax=Apriona germarii TaxID=157307 RepID=A0A7G7WNC7_APRGE|nr:odorant receptor 29 [Apriona germarii]
MGGWLLVYYTYTYLEGSFCLLHLVSPIVDSIINGTKLLPLVDCYPFPIFVSPTYQFMYVYQALVLIWLCWQNYNIDTLITGFLSFSALQCDILCDNLINLKLGEGEEDDEIKKMQEKLVACVEHHSRIDRFIRDVEFCFSWNILEQLACSVITFCTTMFKISLSEPMSKEFFTTIIYQAACFLQVFIYCWSGSVLEEKSEKIPSAAYQCDWVDASKGFKSTLLNFTQRVQRPLRMRTVLFPLSLDVFLQIIKSSFSYYTVLSTLNEK